MRRDQFVWLILIYVFLFILGYWPEFSKNHEAFFKPSLYSIPVTVQTAPSRDS
jgi:hypothetical protein